MHVAPDFDLVVLAGDHLYITSGLSLDAQSAVILKHLGLLHAATARGGTACWTGRRHYGDEDIVGWIDEHHRDIVLTGRAPTCPAPLCPRARTSSVSSSIVGRCAASPNISDTPAGHANITPSASCVT